LYWKTQTLAIERFEEATTATTSITILEHLRYNPSVEQVLSSGSTSIVGRLKPGVVLKSPRFSWWTSSTADSHDIVKDIKHSFSVEMKILSILGSHPNLAKYRNPKFSSYTFINTVSRFLGPSEDPRGLLFAEANRGNLQTFLDTYNSEVDMATRIRWRTQAAGATSYIHQKNVIHSDQRPENYLVHSDDNGVLNIYLSDFGGSTCGNIDGGHLPDSGFFNPRSAWVSTVDTDIFSLGSVFYAIMTGHWPYKSAGPFESVEEKYSYDEKVDALFSEGRFPPVEELVGGAVIQGCWTEQYKDTKTILLDQELLAKEFCIQNT
jgi:serine/threonine protein kinase